MGSFFAWLMESSLLVMMIFTIRRIFTGKISYAGIYALWLVVLLRFMIPVNFISTPFSAAKICSGMFSAWEKGIASSQAGKAGMAGGSIRQDGRYDAGEDSGFSNETARKLEKKINRFNRGQAGKHMSGIKLQNRWTGRIGTYFCGMCGSLALQCCLGGFYGPTYVCSEKSRDNGCYMVREAR